MNQFKQLEWLLGQGYVVAARDPKVNELFPGRFQITGPDSFAFVGEDLSDLVHQVYAAVRSV
jgi:hypothetical protein